MASRSGIGSGRDDAARCPGLNLLAGYAEDRLVDPERETVQTHLAECEDCRQAVAAVRASLALETAHGPRRRPLLRWIPAAAAGLLAAAVVFHLSSASRPSPTDQRLRELAEVLAREHPGQFGGFRPLGLGELHEEPPALRSPEAIPSYPRGRILEHRPPLRWAVSGSDAPWRVRLLRQSDGARILESEVSETHLALPESVPDLGPGTAYVWEAISDAASGRLEARAAFSVATPEERRALEDGYREVDAISPADVAGLVKAHWAIRREFLGEAERLAAEWVRDHPEDPLGRETMRYVRRRVGEPRAGQ